MCTCLRLAWQLYLWMTCVLTMISHVVILLWHLAPNVKGFMSFVNYNKCVEDLVCAIVDSQAMPSVKLWHASCGHLNFVSLLHPQKFEMFSTLPKLEGPSKHVYEGYILGKMQHSSFRKDGSIRATCKLQLIHSDVCGPMQMP